MNKRAVLDATPHPDGNGRYQARVKHLAPGSPVALLLPCGCRYRARVPTEGQASVIIIKGSNKCPRCPSPSREEIRSGRADEYDFAMVDPLTGGGTKDAATVQISASEAAADMDHQTLASHEEADAPSVAACAVAETLEAETLEAAAEAVEEAAEETAKAAEPPAEASAPDEVPAPVAPAAVGPAAEPAVDQVDAPPTAMHAPEVQAAAAPDGETAVGFSAAASVDAAAPVTAMPKSSVLPEGSVLPKGSVVRLRWCPLDEWAHGRVVSVSHFPALGLWQHGVHFADSGVEYVDLNEVAECEVLASP
jgi:hypothetical protein